MHDNQFPKFNILSDEILMPSTLKYQIGWSGSNEMKNVDCVCIISPIFFLSSMKFVGIFDDLHEQKINILFLVGRGWHDLCGMPKFAQLWKNEDFFV